VKVRVVVHIIIGTLAGVFSPMNCQSTSRAHQTLSRMLLPESYSITDIPVNTLYTNSHASVSFIASIKYNPL